MKCQCLPLQKDGHPFSPIIGEIFSECLYTPKEKLSFLIGLSSLVFWCCCQFPQFYKNYKRKSGTGLSMWFLIEWFSGDILNLSGALLTRQLSTQIATGILFVILDSAMLCQVLYYKNKKKIDIPEAKNDHKKKMTIDYLDLNAIDEGAIDEDEMFLPPPPFEESQSARTLSITPTEERTLSAFFIPFVLFGFLSTEQGSNFLSTLGELPNCEPDNDISPFSQHLGYILGWISAVVYLNSRIPQVVKNYKRKSVEGLSMIMFFCAVMGNTTYGLGVILKDSSPYALKKSLPWLVGSLGTLTFDFFIILQFTFYSSKKPNKDKYSYEALEEEDPDIPKTPVRGLFGLKTWTSSPFVGPQDHGYAVLEPSPKQRVLRNHFTAGNITSDEEDDISRMRADSL